jgi:hypothetical protein
VVLRLYSFEVMIRVSECVSEWGLTLSLVLVLVLVLVLEHQYETIEDISSSLPPHNTAMVMVMVMVVVVVVFSILNV